MPIKIICAYESCKLWNWVITLWQHKTEISPQREANETTWVQTVFFPFTIKDGKGTWPDIFHKIVKSSTQRTLTITFSGNFLIEKNTHKPDHQRGTMWCRLDRRTWRCLEEYRCRDLHWSPQHLSGKLSQKTLMLNCTSRYLVPR